MEFGKFDLKDRSELKTLDADRVIKIEIVCTDYPRGINLAQLNNNRLIELKKAFPELAKNNRFEFQTIRQTKFNGKAEAQKMFHGIVITYLPKPTLKSRKEELKNINKLLSGVPLEAKGMKMNTNVIDEKESDPTMESTGKPSHIPVETPAEIPAEMIVTEEVLLGTDYEKRHYTKVTTVINGIKTVTYSGSDTMTKSYVYQPDSTVFKIFDRNKKWSNMLIAADLTGSMYPYTAQLLAWLQLNSKTKKAKNFVFFNDGNATPDRKKIIGLTGGIYLSKTNDFQEVKKLAQKTMYAGGGGDAPENNVEALLRGIKANPNCKDIIMIADNWAPIKDIQLAEKITKPVKIILCGVWTGINTDYLNLARITGGSIHTIEEDLTDLALLNEGESIELFGVSYTISEGKFIRDRKA